MTSHQEDHPPITPQTREKLRKLEESLWLAETRFDRAYMESVLAPDFFEFGRSGRIYTRRETLAAPTAEIHARLPLRDFKVTPIAPDVMLVTYISELMSVSEVTNGSEVQGETRQIGNRSSLWVRTGDKWQLKFHQGTVVEE